MAHIDVLRVRAPRAMQPPLSQYSILRWITLLILLLLTSDSVQRQDAEQLWEKTKRVVESPMLSLLLRSSSDVIASNHPPAVAATRAPAPTLQHQQGGTSIRIDPFAPDALPAAHVRVPATAAACEKDIPQT